MATKRTPRPRDPIQLGQSLVDIATAQVSDMIDDGTDAGGQHLSEGWHGTDSTTFQVTD